MKKKSKADKLHEALQEFIGWVEESLKAGIQAIIDHFREIAGNPLNPLHKATNTLLQILKVRELIPPVDLVRERYFTAKTLEENPVFNVPKFKGDTTAEKIIRMANDINARSHESIALLSENAYRREKSSKEMEEVISDPEYQSWRNAVLSNLGEKESLFKHSFRNKNKIPPEMTIQRGSSTAQKLHRFMTSNLYTWLDENYRSSPWMDLLRLEADARMRWVYNQAARELYRAIRKYIGRRMRRFFILCYIGRHVRLGKPPSMPFGGLMPAFDKVLMGFREIVSEEDRRKMDEVLIDKIRNRETESYLSELFRSYLEWYPCWAEIMRYEDRGAIPRSKLEMEQEFRSLDYEKGYKPVRSELPKEDSEAGKDAEEEYEEGDDRTVTDNEEDKEIEDGEEVDHEDERREERGWKSDLLKSGDETPSFHEIFIHKDDEGEKGRSYKKPHQKIDIQIMNQLLDGICTPAEASAIRKRFYEGMTEREIAAEGGVSHVAIHKRIVRGIEKMRRHIAA